jgi:hypothetical protein
MFRKPLAIGAMVVGATLGSYGIASAASGTSTTTTTTPSATAPAAPPQGGTPWGRQRSDETPLTGDALAKVTAAAQAKLGSGATIVRVETDADGHATYEAHATKADGTPVTVYVDASYDVVSVSSPS